MQYPFCPLGLNLWSKVSLHCIKPDASLLTYFIPAAAPLILMTPSGTGGRFITCTSMMKVLIQIIPGHRTTPAANPILQSKNHLGKKEIPIQLQLNSALSWKWWPCRAINTCLGSGTHISFGWNNDKVRVWVLRFHKHNIYTCINLKMNEKHAKKEQPKALLLINTHECLHSPEQHQEIWVVKTRLRAILHMMQKKVVEWGSRSLDCTTSDWRQGFHNFESSPVPIASCY